MVIAFEPPQELTEAMTFGNAAGVSTPAFQESVTVAVDVIVAQRAVIEQAKGMLMFVYGVDGDTAFDLMRRQSQDHNLKLRLIAVRIVDGLIGLARMRRPSGESGPDSSLLAAHQFIANVAAG